MSRTKSQVEASAIAQQRMEAMTSGEMFMHDQEWSLDFRKLLKLVVEERAQEFEEAEESSHGAVREDCAAQAGFLLGIEIGKRLVGGAS
jgi:hypothetical protein